MGSWENQQKPAKSENSNQIQFSQISICSAWLRKYGKILCCPFLSKFRLAGKIYKNQIFELWLMTMLLGTHWLLVCSLLGIALPLYVSFCVWELRKDLKIQPDTKMNCSLFVARVLPTVASSQRIDWIFLPFFFFLVIFRNGYCSWVSIFCTLFEDTSHVHEAVLYFQVYLLFVLVQIWQR